MSIGRVRKFGVKVAKIIDSVQKSTGGDPEKDIKSMELEAMFLQYGDIAFQHVTDIFNWIFSYKNSEYENMTVDWIDENISIRILIEIVTEIARQNQLSGLIPFFQENYRSALKVMKG